jgi:uncharacterized membrane protein (DUF4010 family)
VTDTSTTLLSLIIALGLGLLVGLERERSASPIAGLRTFALVTVLGTVCGLLAIDFGGWVVALGLVALAALTVAANLAMSRSEAVDPGQTTEVALLLMFGVGAYLAVGSRPVAVALGGAVAVLLHMKERLHQWAGRISERDYRAMMRFALISLVVLPVLPDRAFPPWGVLNPREIWWMVVLIVGIGLAAYVGRKLLGERAGTLVAGLLGGAVSSTATTVSQARQTRGEGVADGGAEGGAGAGRGAAGAGRGAAGAAAAVIALASAVVLARMLIEIAVVAPGFLAAAALPLGILLAVLAVLALGLWITATRDGTTVDQPGNPAELRPALLFAALYAAVLVAVAAAERWLGTGGIYAVAALSGLTDADAITLSTSRLVREGSLAPEVGWRALVIAAMANLAFKGGAVAVLGSRRLLVRVGAVYAVAIAAGAALLALL